MDNKYLQFLSSAVLRLLRPLVRILLRNGISYKTFIDLAKWVYVDVAMKEFGIEGRKQSISRVSVITGLSRKEVLRVHRLGRPDSIASTEKYNRAARVIAGWHRDKDFLDAQGRPASLPMNGRGATFTELVRRFSGDVPVRAIQDELIRKGAVKRLRNNRICLLARGYVPGWSNVDKLQTFGKDVSCLITTIDHNFQHSNNIPFFQRKVFCDNLPKEALPKFRKLSTKRAERLLEHLDLWLNEHDGNINSSVKGTGRHSAGLGIYYFEEPYDDKNI
jgi:hypothetical protein